MSQEDVMESLPMSTAVAELPGGFNAIVFALATAPHSNEVALLGVVAARTGLRALWGGMHQGGYNRASLKVFNESYTLPSSLAIVGKGAQDRAEWWLLAAPNVIVAGEQAARAYAGRAWPLPPAPAELLPVLENWRLHTRIGSGDYLAPPPPQSEVWSSLIRRVVVGDEVDEEVM